MTLVKELRVKELRRFGFAFAGGMTLMAAISLWRGVSWWPVPVALGSLALLGALVHPPVLAPFERVLDRVVRTVTRAFTWILLVLAFAFVITPVGLLLRWVFRKDLLECRIDPSVRSYWTPSDAEGSAARPEQPY